jgi:hypothetical protein
MVKIEDFNKLIKFKEDNYNLFLKNKVDPIEFGYKTYFFIRQTRMKPEKKPHDLNSIVFNYLYWMSNIERNITAERVLAKYNVDSIDKLNEINLKYSRRTNQMLRRILYECSEEITIESIKLIVNDLVEIKLKEFTFPFYAKRETLERIKVEIPENYEESLYKKYLPYVYYTFKLDII